MIRVLLLTLSFWVIPAYALKVNLTPYLPWVEVEFQGRIVKVMRNQDPEHKVTGFWAKTSRPCPPFCIHPIKVHPQVETVGEVEIFDFMMNELRQGEGLLIDARTPKWYQRGTIPGAINIPWTVLREGDENDIAFLEALETLGVKEAKPTPWKNYALLRKVGQILGIGIQDSHWDFRKAKEILIFCNGIWCDQSPRAIKGLLKIGYPPEKIHWYRGGMQTWMILGLTTVVPKTSD